MSTGLARRLPRLPTRTADWRLMARTARLVLSIPGYAVTAAVGASVGLTLFVLTQNLEAAAFALTGDLPLAARATILAELYPFLGTVYTSATSVTLVVLAGLIGVDLAMVLYHLREHDLAAREGTTSALGLLLGTLGAGCAACGTAVLAGVLSLLGATGVLTLLPLEGLELSLVGLVVVVLSIYWLADGMRGGEVKGCPVDP